MQINELKSLLEQSMVGSRVMVEGDDHHVNVVVISEQFADCAKVKRQQMVYGVLQKYILSGDLHAINMKTYTEQEWEQLDG